MQQTIERNKQELRKKESKIKKRVNIIDYTCTSPTSKVGSRYNDQSSALRNSVKKSQKSTIINSSPKKGNFGNNLRESYISQKQSTNYTISQPSYYLKRQRERNVINQ